MTAASDDLILKALHQAEGRSFEPSSSAAGGYLWRRCSGLAVVNCWSADEVCHDARSGMTAINKGWMEVF